MKNRGWRFVYLIIVTIIGMASAFSPYFFEYLPSLHEKHEFGKISQEDKDKMADDLDNPNIYLINN